MPVDRYPPSRDGTDDRPIPRKQPRKDTNREELPPQQERDRRGEGYRGGRYRRRSPTPDRTYGDRRNRHRSLTPEVKARRERDSFPPLSPPPERNRGEREKRGKRGDGKGGEKEGEKDGRKERKEGGEKEKKKAGEESGERRDNGDTGEKGPGDRRGNREQPSATNIPLSKDPGQAEESIKGSAHNKRHEEHSATASYRTTENTTGARQNNLPGQRSTMSKESSDNEDPVTDAQRMERRKREERRRRDSQARYGDEYIPRGVSVIGQEPDGRLVMRRKPLKQYVDIPDIPIVRSTKEAGGTIRTYNAYVRFRKSKTEKSPKDERGTTEDARASGSLGDRVSSGMRKVAERAKGKGKEPEGANVLNNNLEDVEGQPGRHAPDEKWDYPSQRFPDERNPYGSSSSKARPAGSTSRPSIYRQTNHSNETIQTQLPAYKSTTTLAPDYEESQSAQPAQSSRRAPRDDNGRPSRRP